MTKFNPNKLTILDNDFDEFRRDDDLVIEFYSNAREVIVNGMRFSMKAQDDGFVINKRIK